MANVNAVAVVERMRELSPRYAKPGTSPANNVQIATMLAIAYAENFGKATSHDLVDHLSNSSGNVDAPGSVDRGMWMINSYFHSECSDECAYDWRCATEYVAKITSGFKTNFSLWSAYNNGNYKVHLPIAWMAIRVADARVRERKALEDQVVLRLERDALKIERDALGERIATIKGTARTASATIASIEGM